MNTNDSPTASPVIISPRLLPGVRIDSVRWLGRDDDNAGAPTVTETAWVSVESTDDTNRDGKPRWRYFIDLPDGTEHVGDDLHGWGDAGEMLATLLAFLDACAESRRYSDGDGENSRLFPDDVGAWAEHVSDELGLLRLEIEEGADR